MSDVADSSVATMWFAREPHSDGAAALLDGEDVLLVPDLIYAETANALWKKEMRGEISSELVEQALVSLIALDLVVTPSARLLEEAARLAARARHPVYDCLYVCLARREDAVLATADRRLARLAGQQALAVWTPNPGAG